MSPALLQDEAVTMVEAAAAVGVELRLIGGIAIQLRCPSVSHRSLTRTAGDVDYCVRAADVPRLEAIFAAGGYEPWLPFNRLNAQHSQRFDRNDGSYSVDVFVDQLRMCHNLDFRDRLTREPLTLPLADLLLSKLQIVELTEKDLLDLGALLAEHPVGSDDEETIDGDRVAAICSSDWGLEHTIERNLERLGAEVPRLREGDAGLVRERIERLRGQIASHPKTRKWRMRALVGERMPWFEEPDEVADEH